jgi:hypothetical protein
MVSNSAMRNRLAIAMLLAATEAAAAQQVSSPEPQATGTGAIAVAGRVDDSAIERRRSIGHRHLDPGDAVSTTTSSPPSTNAAWTTGRALDFSRQSRNKRLLCALPQANRGP